MENKDLFGFPPSLLYICIDMINDLLKQRDELSDLASIMYGELYVSHEDFWGSPLENEMSEVELSLFEMGWEPEDLSPEVYEASIVVVNNLLDKD
jgi:hypothetical protein